MAVPILGSEYFQKMLSATWAESKENVLDLTAESRATKESLSCAARRSGLDVPFRSI